MLTDFSHTQAIPNAGQDRLMRVATDLIETIRSRSKQRSSLSATRPQSFLSDFSLKSKLGESEAGNDEVMFSRIVHSTATTHQEKEV